jgi:hypothetical protein
MQLVPLHRVAPHPFTTIEPNLGRAFAPVPCPCASAGLRRTCAPAHGAADVDGVHCRRLPVFIKDVAGKGWRHTVHYVMVHVTCNTTPGSGTFHHVVLLHRFKTPIDDRRTFIAMVHVTKRVTPNREIGSGSGDPGGGAGARRARGAGPRERVPQRPVRRRRQGLITCLQSSIL